MIDACDAALFALRCAEGALGGVWNVTGRPMPLSELLDAIRRAAGSEAEIVWVDGGAVVAAGIEPWSELPLMTPPGEGFRHFLEVDAARARAAGLSTRPLDETLDSLLAWDRSRRERPLQCGIGPEQEAALLG